VFLIAAPDKNHLCAELFIDIPKKNYTDLGYKKFNVLTIGPAMIVARNIVAKVNEIQGRRHGGAQ